MIASAAHRRSAPSHRLFGVVSTLLFAMALGACDTSKPATASNAAGASVIAAAGPQPAIACPSKDLSAFVAAFAEDPSLQKAFTADTVDTAFVDMNAQPEPAESVEPMPREKLRFPVMPNRAQQQKEGLKYREVANEGGRAVVVLEIPDTDAQVLYTFRRDACWTLVKIVDPAFGSAFPGEGPAGNAPRASTPTSLSDGSDASKGLSNLLTECMARAGSQNIAQAECLTAERDRQDARLNRIYKALIANLQGDRRDRMVEAQRMWAQLQQKDGAFEASVLDELGPMGNLQSVDNEARAIGQRADLLEKYLEMSKL
jgi:uncharacterized protein YecT (DUF1311 family)